VGETIEIRLRLHTGAQTGVGGFFARIIHPSSGLTFGMTGSSVNAAVFSAENIVPQERDPSVVSCAGRAPSAFSSGTDMVAATLSYKAETAGKWFLWLERRANFVDTSVATGTLYGTTFETNLLGTFVTVTAP
jgi:hypothetical protein